MPITVEVIDSTADEKILDKVFKYFEHIDEKFSTYKDISEISKINRGEIKIDDASDEMKEVFALCDQTKKETNGYFDIQTPKKKYDLSGLVKGWAIFNAAKILVSGGLKNFYVEAGGDVEARGLAWRVGIKNPFKQDEIVKVLLIKDQGVATSGTYIRSQHIYNPHQKGQNIDEIVSLTVIGPNVYEADRFATAAFAMGVDGINFIEKLDGFEGYVIDKDGIGTETSGLKKYYA